MAVKMLPAEIIGNGPAVITAMKRNRPALLPLEGPLSLTGRGVALPEAAHLKTLDAFLDAVTAPELPEWVHKRGKKQGELLRREIECFDGGAGAKIYEYCKKAALKT